jgi:antitoxin PrlF
MTIAIKINSRGSMTLPKPLREKLGVGTGGLIVAEATDHGVVLEPAATFPIELYSDERIAEFDEADAALKQRLDQRRK